MNAIATMIAQQAAFGFAVGFIALRTRSILITSVFHALYDEMSDLSLLIV